MKTRLLNDGDVAGYLDGDKLIKTQNGVVLKEDNTHAEIGQNGKIVRIFSESKPKKENITLSEEKLQELRAQIDEIDDKLLDLYFI